MTFDFPKISHDEIVQNLLHEIPEHKTIQLIQSMSEIFNKRVPAIHSYSREKEFVSAYTQFYLPTNYPKLLWIYSQLQKVGLDPLGLAQGLEVNFLDFGCGPGTFSLAQLLYDHKSSIILSDKSTLMVDQAQNLLKGLLPKIKIISEFQKKAFKIICFGNVINEMGSSKALNSVKSNNPDYVVAIEPGTKFSFYEMLKFRDLMLGSGYQVIFPCPSNQPCPMLNQSDWCHQVLRCTHDPSIERISQMAKKDRKILPLIGHVYCRKEVTTSQKPHSRMVRFLGESKFSFDYELCQREEEQNTIVQRIILRKNLSKSQLKQLKKASVGDCLDGLVKS